MTLQEVKRYFYNYRKGSFKKIKWVKPVTLKNKQVVFKEVETVARFNINYGNLATVKERNKEKEGQEEQTSLRPETIWLYDKLVKQTSKGKEVLTVYTTKKHRSKVVWKDSDGNVINKKDIENLLYASDKSKSGTTTDMFYVDITNIVSIG